jgi:uncharacterized protein (TIGR03663 family)
MALVVRLPQPAGRPMHTDEAINAYITGRLLAGDTYHYDPRDRHGPILYAVAVPIARLAGAKNLAGLTETTLRLGPILTGSLTILLFAALAPEIGLAAALLAALLWAVAPLPVYYSRYFIHETLFVAATLGLLTAGWRWLKTGSLPAGVLTGFWAALLIAGKETAVLTLAAAGVAVSAWLLRERFGRVILRPRLFAVSGGFIGQPARRPHPEIHEASRTVRWLGAALGLVVLLVVITLFYTWGGHNRQGLADLLNSLPRFVARAGGEGHAKPWWYYLQLLVRGWSGWALLLLAGVGTVTALKGGDSAAHSGALSVWLLYGIAITILYSAIPYKTPWLGLNLFLPLAVLAGAGAVTLWELASELTQTQGTRPALLAGAVIVLLLLGHDTRRRVFLQPADESNPYAYAHTGEDLPRLPERLHTIAGQQSTLAVISADPWPLPWYLRGYPRVGYWQPGQNPGRADYYLTSPEAAPSLKNLLAGWRPEYFGVRPGVLLILWTPPASR